jgi:Chalcone isomerase-like
MEPEREEKKVRSRRGQGKVWWLVLLLALVAGTVDARMMAGVRLPDAISLQGREVLLEHVALKKKLFFELYVWGLYLEQRPDSVKEAIAFQGPKQLQLHFRRNIKRDQLVEAFRQFLTLNPELRTPEMRRHAETLVNSLRGVRKGDTLLVTYIPGKGLVISGEASQGAFIPGKAFADALFTAWLMENPIYDK